MNKLCARRGLPYQRSDGDANSLNGGRLVPGAPLYEARARAVIQGLTPDEWDETLRILSVIHDEILRDATPAGAEALKEFWPRGMAEFLAMRGLTQ